MQPSINVIMTISLQADTPPGYQTIQKITSKNLKIVAKKETTVAIS